MTSFVKGNQISLNKRNDLMSDDGPISEISQNSLKTLMVGESLIFASFMLVPIQFSFHNQIYIFFAEVNKFLLYY